MTQSRWNIEALAILLLTAALVTVSAAYVLEKARSSKSGSGEGASVHAPGQVIHWRLVTAWPKGFPGLGTAPERFADMVREMSGGRLDIQVFGANELVPAMGVFDVVSSGSVEMGHAGAYYWKGKAPAAQFFTTVPFGMTAQEMNAWLYYGGGMELWRELYARFDLIPLAGGNTGVQMPGWFNKEIHSLADVQGLKIRLPGLAGEVFGRIGATAVNIPGGELYTSLRTGVIDAVEWVGPYNDMAMGFHEAARYYYYPGWHEPGSTLEMIVNRQAFERLPPDLQAIIVTAARAANQDMLDEYTAKNIEALRELVDTHKVQLRRLPDDVLRSLKKASDEALQALVADDPFARRVYASYSHFATGVAQYHRISEQAYLEARSMVDEQP
ncbi:MAG TPA: TRAP transporter substrate-binding protein [Pseudomonadales bacterium]